MTALERRMAADAIALHAEAERRWADLRSEVENMRTAKHEEASVCEHLEQSKATERCYGAVDALDWTLREIDRMAGAKAESSDEQQAKE